MKRLRATLIKMDVIEDPTRYRPEIRVARVRGPLTANWARGIEADMVLLDRRPRNSPRDALDLSTFQECMANSMIRSLYIPE